MRQLLKQNDVFRRLYYRLRMLRSKGQSNEVDILHRLTANAARTFVEFGFHPMEFNCAALARSPDWEGLLIDGNSRQVQDARALLPGHIRIVEAFLTLENLDLVRTSFTRIGVLSIDVDGNDYWFLRELIGNKPDVICVEYNASFGIDSVTVPYEAEFDRFKKHPSGWYHGASLTALAVLCAAHGYGLAAVSHLGTNAFFTSDGSLDPKTAWKANALRDRSGIGFQEQYDTVRNLPLVAVPA